MTHPNEDTLPDGSPEFQARFDRLRASIAADCPGFSRDELDDATAEIYEGLFPDEDDPLTSPA